MNTLHQLAGRLSGSHTSFVNEIPADVFVEHNYEWVAGVISGLLSSVVVQSKDDSIRLTAKRYGYIIVFMIQKNGSLHAESMKGHISPLQSMAEKIGGCITINDLPGNTTGIAFSFPNLPAAA